MNKTETVTLDKIYEDLELLKKYMLEIRTAINLEPELRNEIKQQVKEARERMLRGEFVSNKEILKDFGLE